MMASLSLFRQPSSVLLSLTRCFSSIPSAALGVVPFKEPKPSDSDFSEPSNTPEPPKKALKKDPPKKLHVPPTPAYPHGPALHYRQSNRGLYGGGKLLFGNIVSEKNEIKTRRKWRLNVKDKRLFSKALGKELKVRLTTHVLRTINKVGGLDEYLLGEKSARIKELGVEGWRLRWMIMQTDMVKERYRKQRVEMGLEAPQIPKKPKASEKPAQKQIGGKGGWNFNGGTKQKQIGVPEDGESPPEPFDEVKFLEGEIKLLGDGRPEKE